jgi:hypothetical protein
VRDWGDRLLIPAATLILNAAMTYGVVSTQIQWLRSDLTRQQVQIDRIEARQIDGKRG